MACPTSKKGHEGAETESSIDAQGERERQREDDDDDDDGGGGLMMYLMYVRMYVYVCRHHYIHRIQGNG